jgi:preprotein translocase subunit SecA
MPEDDWPDEDSQEGDDSGAREPRAAGPNGHTTGQAAAPPEDKKAAQAIFIDLTRNIQRQKDREMQTLLAGNARAGTSTGEGPVIRGDKVGRNDPCPCGSGKKYKKCHGAGK